MSGKNNYNEFLKSDEGIATNVLADRLSMLERVGILIKEKHPESKANFFYRLSQLGIDLLPVLVEMFVHKRESQTLISLSSPPTRTFNFGSKAKASIESLLAVQEFTSS